MAGDSSRRSDAAYRSNRLLRRDARLVGTVVQGRYHLVRPLGIGGMGSVYKAADRVLRRFVAIKVLHPHVVRSNPSAVERFEREARTAASIGHPNIIEILDFGTMDHAPFLVMEYLRGHPLSRAIALDGPIPVERVCRIATHALAGLAAAHGRGILHRDLKPGNLMLCSYLRDSDFVKILDFGFAALLIPTQRFDDTDRTLTPERTLVGTPAYAAPERLRGDDRRDPRLDVYSMGVIIYEMLCGRRPFEASTFAELARKVKKDPPAPLRDFRSDVPQALEDAVMRALAKQREDRFVNAEDFARALVPFGGLSVPEDEPVSDSFSMDLLHIQARANAHSDHTADQDVFLGADTIVSFSSVPAQASVDGEINAEDPGPLGGDTQIKVALNLAGESVLPIFKCSGALVLPILRFVAGTFGALALKKVLDTLPEESRAVFQGGVTADSWVDFEVVQRFMTLVDQQLGRDDLRLVVECGRAAAAALLVEESPQFPQNMLEQLPSILSVLFRGIGLTIELIGSGYARLQLEGSGKAALVTSVLLLGLIESALQQAGGKDVEVALISCTAFGDDSTTYDISWLHSEEVSR